MNIKTAVLYTELQPEDGSTSLKVTQPFSSQSFKIPTIVSHRKVKHFGASRTGAEPGYELNIRECSSAPNENYLPY